MRPEILRGDGQEVLRLAVRLILLKAAIARANVGAVLTEPNSFLPAGDSDYSRVADHLCRNHPLIKLLDRYITRRDCGLAKRAAFLMRLFCNESSLVITDVWVQRSHQHQ